MEKNDFFTECVASLGSICSRCVSMVFLYNLAAHLSERVLSPGTAEGSRVSQPAPFFWRYRFLFLRVDFPPSDTLHRERGQNSAIDGRQCLRRSVHLAADVQSN